MASPYRVSAISALIVCLVITQSNGVFASEPPLADPAVTGAQAATTTGLLSNNASSPARSFSAFSDSVLASRPLLNAPDAQTWQSTFTFVPTASDAFAQRGGYRGGRGRDRDRGRATGRHGGAAAALVLGAVASVTGAAILVYANRPECSTNPYRADGCGYGTKVIGGAALSMGVVGFTIAAITW